MIKLANISMFEGLQNQAHSSMGLVSSLSVFNGAYTDEILNKFWDEFEKEADEARKINPKLSDGEIISRWAPVFVGRRMASRMWKDYKSGNSDYLALKRKRFFLEGEIWDVLKPVIEKEKSKGEYLDREYVFARTILEFKDSWKYLQDSDVEIPAKNDSYVFTQRVGDNTPNVSVGGE